MGEQLVRELNEFFARPEIRQYNKYARVLECAEHPFENRKVDLPEVAPRTDVPEEFKHTPFGQMALKGAPAMKDIMDKIRPRSPGVPVMIYDTVPVWKEFKNSRVEPLLSACLYSVFMANGYSGIVTNEPDSVSLLQSHKWFISRDGYMSTNVYMGGRRRPNYFHVMLLEKKGILEANRDKTSNVRVVDHINGDKLDNRVENLRLLTYGANCANRTRAIHKFGVAGISATRVNGFDYIVASWCNARRLEIAHFPVLKYGYEGALASAIQARKQAISKIPIYQELEFRPVGFDPLKYALPPVYFLQCLNEPIPFLSEPV